MKPLISLQELVPRLYNSPFHQPLNWEMNEGEVWAITGRNGSGKSLFAEVIAGRYNQIRGKIEYSAPDKKQIRIVSFNSVYSIADFREAYYQQRFNQTEIDESPLAGNLFPNRRLIQLSSGELRKLLIYRILQEESKLIIFDNPFIGLDVQSRKQLDETFVQLHQKGIQLVFLVPSKSEMPSVTTNELVIDSLQGIAGQARNGRDRDKNRVIVDWSLFPESPPEAEIVVKMEDITINYGEIIIAQGINWEIKRGEKWALSGANGSGKSTLLSYIFADNPQAYSKKLTLFDHKRGTGESIWDIKKRIGFTSSEMHLYYRAHVSCLAVVESGFFDSIGLYRKCTEAQAQVAEYLFDILEMHHLKERPFLQVSSGEQRLVLFARSLVKNPELLILDEPFHGLDDENKQRCLQIVESYCQQPNKSLIFVTHRQEEIPDSVEYYLSLTSRM